MDQIRNNFLETNKLNLVLNSRQNIQYTLLVRWQTEEYKNFLKLQEHNRKVHLIEKQIHKLQQQKIELCQDR